MYMKEYYSSTMHAFVSKETPLLSNLSIRENISLILQIHTNLSREASLKKSFEALEKLNLGYAAEFRYNQCNSKELFKVQLVRASMIKEAQLLIDQPFSLVREELSLDFIFEALRCLDLPISKVLILDLSHQENYYQEQQCHIIK